jgi:threonine aldolase
MLYFRNDYGEGAHPDVLRALADTNGASTGGYGEDPYTRAAQGAIRDAVGIEGVAVYFVTGGTQANLLAISSALRPHEAVLSADTGHINVHETGAIEATGHKVITVDAPDGKVSVDALQRAVERHADHHMVKPRLVYISDATELGTIYTKADLQALRAFLDARDLLLFIDGARLGAALTADGNDLTLPDLAALCDVFTIGGTKNGLLFGEAIVIPHPALRRDFPYLIKQRGALLAKGRLLGVQFGALFRDDLFYRIGRHENEMAAKLRRGLTSIGFSMYADSPTNQLFPIVTREQCEKLKEVCAFEQIEQLERDVVIRLVTSWATRAEDVDGLLAAMGKL